MTTPPRPAKGKKVSWKWWAVGGGIAVLAGLGWYLWKQSQANSAAAATTTADTGSTVADDSGQLSAIQSELESLQQEEAAEGGTTTTAAGGGSTAPAGTATVPAVEGMGINPAEAKIKAAGLTPKLNTKVAGGTSYVISSQTPGAGKKVAKGSTVDLAAEKTPVPVKKPVAKVVGRK